MKRLTAILLVLALILTTTACSLIDHSGANGENTENNSTDFTTETNDISINEETENAALSKQEIYNSVSSFVSDITYNSEHYSTYNFTDEGTLFFFQFYIFGNERRLFYLLKSYDGGKTWYFRDIQSAPSMSWREQIVCAKMLNERVGLISGSLFATDNNFSERTYITTNGGRDWTQVVLPATPPYLNEKSALLSNYLDGEAYDLTHENGIYYLHVRCRYYDPVLDEGVYVYFCYSSTDLVNWTFVENTETDTHQFISQEEKNTWRDKLINLLSNCDIYGSFAVGLMDLNFDNSPEVLIAYPGGSMGNVFTTFYELDTGEKLFIYNADHWNSDNNINLCVAEDDNGELVILSEGSLRGEIDVGYINYIRYVRVFPKYVDFNAPVLYANNFLAESTDSDSPKHYYYKDQEVDKSEYDTHVNDYQRIASTQIQLVTHEIIDKDSEINTDPDSRKDFAEKMADALINSSQEFIDCKAAGITMGKYPYVPEMYHPILDAYYKMDTYKKNVGSIDGIVIADYPELSEANFNALLDYTKEFNSYGRGFFLYDINLDGTDEMIFSSWGGGTSSKYYIEMVFTGDGNEAKLIGKFENNDYKYFTKIGDDGRIHCSITGKGEKGVTHHVFSFDKTGTTEVFSYGISDLRDYYDYPCELEWLKYQNGEWVNITEQEFLMLEEIYAFNEINNGFEFRYFFKFAPK